MDFITRRRNAREIAMHVVYERSFDFDSVEGIVTKRLSNESFAELSEEADVYSEPLPVKECLYIRRLTSLIEENDIELQETIALYSTKWKTERISRISRAILKIALCESRWFDDISISVSINEAVELAKKYESDEGAAFINGILGSYARSLDAEISTEKEDESDSVSEAQSDTE